MKPRQARVDLALGVGYWLSRGLRLEVEGLTVGHLAEWRGLEERLAERVELTPKELDRIAAFHRAARVIKKIAEGGRG